MNTYVMTECRVAFKFLNPAVCNHSRSSKTYLVYDVFSFHPCSWNHDGTMLVKWRALPLRVPSWKELDKPLDIFLIAWIFQGVVDGNNS